MHIAESFLTRLSSHQIRVLNDSRYRPNPSNQFSRGFATAKHQNFEEKKFDATSWYSFVTAPFWLWKKFSTGEIFVKRAMRVSSWGLCNCRRARSSTVSLTPAFRAAKTEKNNRTRSRGSQRSSDGHHARHKPLTFLSHPPVIALHRQLWSAELTFMRWTANGSFPPKPTRKATSVSALSCHSSRQQRKAASKRERHHWLNVTADPSVLRRINVQEAATTREISVSCTNL